MSQWGLSPSAAGDATRQKLDELDALIQQMLDLPVNRLDPEAEDRGQRTENREQKTENREQRTENREQTAEDSGHGIEDNEQEIKDRGARTEDSEPKVETEESDQKAADSKPVAGEEGPSQAVVLSSVLCPSPPGPSSRARWWLYPVVGLNLLFDGLTFLLGPLGRWLRGETGRLLIGWVGVALLLAGLVWAFLGWMGWIN
jgi:hypothetical protein